MRQLINSAAQLRRPIRVHVIDVHGDIAIPGASEVLFSQSTAWGFNPLEINPDPHFGGVRRAIQLFIEAVKRQKTIGTKQEAVLRYLLEDLYDMRGFKIDEPISWIPEDPALIRERLAGKENRLYLAVSWDQRDRFKELIRGENGQKFGDWDGDLKCWWVDRSRYEGDLLMWSPRVMFKASPTLDDLVAFSESKLKALFMGGNGAAMAFLKDHHRAAALFHRKVMDLAKKGEVLAANEFDALSLKLDENRGKAVKSFDSFLESVKTGRELDEVLRYNSVDVLTSVYERLQNLRGVGIFRSDTPPFDPRSPVWRYVLKPLGTPEQRMFVAVVLRRIFDRAVQRGEQNDVVEVIVVDEASRFAYEDDDNILSVIANEARKFGLALWCAAQSPNAFSDDFLKNVAFKVVLGVAEVDRALCVRKLGFDLAVHNRIIPRSVGLVQVRNAGEIEAPFIVTTMK
ncbi:hypothetical protein ACVBEF_04645 [Glaciimonas sp. GG7]